ncbi:MAG TPA: IPT/TIG domain-containing protein [Candidatus Ozemobacteraceae bacterium]|nr:IPT/TIG domain-containing protein [Candidatus Ozemobacteraceae bacterium]
MNRLLTGFLVVTAFALALGCGGGGSSPTNAIIAPQIVSINPATGGPGTIVQIQGSGFGSVQGASTLSFSGVTIVPNSWSDNVISATIPTNAAADGSFVISVNGRISNPSTIFTLGNPTIYSLSPTYGNPGTLVTIYGNNFGTLTGESRVTFNGQTATVSSWQPNQITCTVPTSLTVSGDVSVVVYANLSRPSNTISFTLTIPTITSISPQTDNVGAAIIINGSGFGFGPTQQTSTVTISGIPATIVYWTDTYIQVKIPNGVAAGANNVIVTVNGRTSTPSSVTVSAPAINTLSPSPVKKDQWITLSGQYFGQTQAEGTSTIFIQGHGLVVTQINWSDSSISFAWPLNKTDQVPVTITVGGLYTTVLVASEWSLF